MLDTHTILIGEIEYRESLRITADKTTTIISSISTESSSWSLLVFFKLDSRHRVVVERRKEGVCIGWEHDISINTHTLIWIVRGGGEGGSLKNIVIIVIIWKMHNKYILNIYVRCFISPLFPFSRACNGCSHWDSINLKRNKPCRIVDRSSIVIYSGGCDKFSMQQE